MVIFLFFPMFWKQRHSPVSTKWLFIHLFYLKSNECTMCERKCTMLKIVQQCIEKGWGMIYLSDVQWDMKTVVSSWPSLQSRVVILLTLSAQQSSFLPFLVPCCECALVLSQVLFWFSISSRMFYLVLKAKYLIESRVEIWALRLLSILFGNWFKNFFLLLFQAQMNRNSSSKCDCLTSSLFMLVFWSSMKIDFFIVSEMNLLSILSRKIFILSILDTFLIFSFKQTTHSQFKGQN